MAVRIEGAYPPETSVPSPTYRIETPISARERFEENGRVHLYSAIEIFSDRRYPTPKVEVRRRTMTYPCTTLFDQLRRHHIPNQYTRKDERLA